MHTVVRTAEFAAWLDDLKDGKARALIVARLDRAEIGLFGDVSDVGDGMREMRVHYGPGYRVYYRMIGNVLVVWAGHKGSQKRDIKKAKAIYEKYQTKGQIR